MNDEELSTAVRELQANTKRLQATHDLIQSQQIEILRVLKSLCLQMEENNCALTSVLDGLVDESVLSNSDSVLIGFRSDGSHQTSLDPSVQTQPAILLMPLKRLVDEDEVAGVEDEDDDVEGDDQTEVVMLVAEKESSDIPKVELEKKYGVVEESLDSSTWLVEKKTRLDRDRMVMTNFAAPENATQIRQTWSRKINTRSGVIEKPKEKTTLVPSDSITYEHRLEIESIISAWTSNRLVANLDDSRKPPPWPPPSRLLGERWPGRTGTEAPTTREAPDSVGLEPAMMAQVETSLFLQRQGSPRTTRSSTWGLESWSPATSRLGCDGGFKLERLLCCALDKATTLVLCFGN